MQSSQKVQFLKSWVHETTRALRTIKLRLFTLSLLLVGILRKRSNVPTSIIYTLTPEQVFFNSSPGQVLRFFQQERIASRANFLEPLIEVRSLRTILLRNNHFTFDASIHILQKLLPRRDYFSIFRLINVGIVGIDQPLSFKLKNFKESTLDPIVYSYFFSRVGNSLDLVTTQSSLLKVPSAFKVNNAPRRIMAWYSTNSKPIYASDDKIRKELNISASKDYISEHWVWNQEEVDFLEYQGLKNVIAVGPVLFQETKMEKKDSNKFVITYFDVTPLSGGKGFYSEENTILILNAIFRLVETLNSKYPGITEIQVKPKRRYSKLHSKAYISQLVHSSKAQRIRKLPSSANLFEIVSKSDLVLAIPFTSPAILAKELSVKSFFVCIGIEGWDVESSSGGIPVIFRFEELLQEVEKEIQSKLKAKAS